MIRGFRDRATKNLFEGRCAPRWRGVRAVAERKLAQLDAAETLDFLRVPPGNQLEKLSGDRAGTWSIRINARWRLCFRWLPEGPDDVEIVDYH